MLSVTYSTVTGNSVTLAVAETATASQQTALIQQALNAVAASGGGSVSLSAGTWTVAGAGNAADGCLKVGSNTRLEGAGAGATTLKLADGSGSVTGIVRTASGATQADGTYATTSNVVIANLSIDGNKAATSGSVDGFYCGPKPGTAQADTNITLDGVDVANCSRYGVDPHERTVGLTIKSVSAHHNGVDGIVVDFCRDVRIENTTAFANGRHGINVVTGSQNVLVLNSSSTGNGGSGLVIQTGDNEARAFTEHVTVSGGTFDGNGRYGIEARQANDISVSGAHIGDNAMGGLRLSGVARAGLDGVVYVGNAGDPIKIDSGYLQTFGDDDPLNDRWIPTTDIRLDGVAQYIPVVVPGAPLWTYAITDGNDTILGSDGRDVIAAHSGNDWVMAGAGDDVIYGEDGNDILDGGAGRDTLYGGAGDDWLIYSGAAPGAVETMDGGAGNDTADFMTAAAGVRVDLLSGGIEVSIGGVAIVDLIRVENARGSVFADTLSGDGYANKLSGFDGNDALYGNAGADTLDGGVGDDLLVGGINKDVLTGGAGRDTFRFAVGDGSDTITDFTRGDDVIDMLGVASFASLKLKQIGADTQIKVGTDTILLQGVLATTLTAGDFQFH